MLPLRDNVPTRSTPFVTLGLIAANGLVWMWELRKPGVDVHVFRDGFYPCAVHGPCLAGVIRIPDGVSITVAVRLRKPGARAV